MTTANRHYSNVPSFFACIENKVLSVLQFVCTPRFSGQWKKDRVICQNNHPNMEENEPDNNGKEKKTIQEADECDNLVFEPVILELHRSIRSLLDRKKETETMNEIFNSAGIQRLIAEANQREASLDPVRDKGGDSYD